MYSPFRLATKYLRYFFTAANGKGHGIHSPFVFDFITHVLNDRRRFPAYQKIEKFADTLRADNRLIQVQDFGAGSVQSNNKVRSVAAIAAVAAKSAKFGRLLFRLANHYKPSVMVELGTSLGLSAAWLATGNPSSQLTTIEGAPELALLAKQNLAELGIENVQVVTGNFNNVLPNLVNSLPAINLAFIDGNHRLEPTMQYFNQLLPRMDARALMVIDDIHWSAEMEQAWKAIKAHPGVLLTIDLFFLGLVFFDPGFRVKQHFIIRF